MATSQFTIYQSSDAGAPALNGLTGSLLNLLDTILVGPGYGSKPASGWLKPFPNTGSVGCYQLPNGSCGLCYHLMDNGPGAGGGTEARLTGWDTISSIFNGAVTGSNQWPTATQLALGNGAVIARKSVNTTNTARNWIAFADSRSCYFYTQAEGTSTYVAFMMGEIYSSVISGSDNYRGVVIGRVGENNSVGAWDRLDIYNLIGNATTGHFISRTYTGYSSGQTFGKLGDYAKGAGAGYLAGGNIYPNPTDGAVYLARVYVHSPTDNYIRGYMRGFWHFCHPIASVSDGFRFSGSGDLTGRIFQIVKPSNNAGLYTMEISNTVETN